MPVIEMYRKHEDVKKDSIQVKKFDSKITSCNLYKEKKLAMIGISLGNSYFSEEKLKLILTGFSENFENVAVLLADEIAIHNFKTKGYSEDKAKQKIHKCSNNTSNKINRVIEEIGSNNIRLYTWAEIEEFNLYQKSLKDITKLYNNNISFSREVRKKIYEKIKGNLDSQDDKEDIIDEAKWYLLKELAFALCASEFFNSPLLTCYYTDFALYREILNNKYHNGTECEKHDTLIYECVE